MGQDQGWGAPASPSGHSQAEPEEVSALRASVPNALGLSRTRLAELLYEHEGFIDAERGDSVPDRDVPVWIESSLTARHSGDCTRECHSCMACHAKWALEQWDEFAAMIARAASAIEARRAETQSGSVHESAVPQGDAQNTAAQKDSPDV